MRASMYFVSSDLIASCDCIVCRKNPTGRALADVKFWTKNSAEIAADSAWRAAAPGLKPLRLSHAPVPLPGTLECVASR